MGTLRHHEELQKRCLYVGWPSVNMANHGDVLETDGEKLQETELQPSIPMDFVGDSWSWPQGPQRCYLVAAVAPEAGKFCSGCGGSGRLTHSDAIDLTN